jgi:membrane protease YdiL (CAAX protease family)
MEDSPVPQQEPSFRWEVQDLIAFFAFSVATVVFLPGAVFLVLGLFQPGLEVKDLSGVQQILIQAIMDILLVGFIVFLVAAVHKVPILRTLYFVPNEYLRIGRSILGGAFLAVTVLVITSFFPTPSESPLEKLLTTTPSIVLFVVFGIAMAPLLEEIIFRSFIFSALADLIGWKKAVPITTVSFAALHITQLRGNWPAVAVILLVGYVLTIVRHRTNSVIPSVIIHTAYNSMIFGAAALIALLGSVDR